MASRYLLTTLYFIIICFKTLTAASNSSFYFKSFGQDSNFDSVITLHGDATVANGGSPLQLTAPLASSAGRVVYKNRIEFYKGVPKKLVSFSTYFSFSISSGSGFGNGLSFVVFPDVVNDLKLLSVEFDALLNHVAIDLKSNGFVSLKVMNLSRVDFGLSSGDKLQAWIDYEAMSRRLEVRVSKFGGNRPVDPMLFEHIDLPKIWPEKDGFYVGLSSWNGNSSQICNVYSWSFKTRRAPDWMHSEAVDPALLKDGGGSEVKGHKRSDCVMRALSALILGVGLGALGSLIGMFVWTIFAKREQISPEGYGVKAVVVHDKGSANGKQ